jgi:photosystem II stability/assembly factor-like uncharacterized protein
MTGVSWGQGDITKIECPSDDQFDQFVEIGKIKGAKDRVTTSLEGRLAIDVKSEILRLVRKGCSVDVQLNLGDCTDPRIFTAFKKKLIFEEVDFTNFSTEDLGALSSGDRAAVNETGEISSKDLYEIVPLSFAERAGTLVTNEVLDVVICDMVSCGDCSEESDGCQKIFAITKAAGGSPGTPADVVYSIDGGATWHVHDIDSMDAVDDPDELDCLGDYLVVVSADSCSLHYALKSEFDGVTDPDFTEVLTGFVAGGCPTAIKSVGNYAFIVGNNGYIYGTGDPTAGVDVLDAGVATADDFYAVDALDSSFAVAVGENSAIVKTENGSTWSVVGGPTGIGVTYHTIAVKSETEWWIGTSTGVLYVTYDGGVTWNLQTFPGSGTGVVYSIVFATSSIVYLAHQTAATKGRILRSYDGGYQWVVLPESTGTLPVNDKVNALAACTLDPNMVVGVGLADNGTDGFIVVGEGN